LAIISSPPATDPCAIVAELVHCPARAAARLSGGRNSQIYRVDMAGGRTVAAKLYHRSAADRRDRLGVEWTALKFLWEQGVRVIPRPIAADPEHGCLVYEFVDGVPVRDIQAGDVDACVEFLEELSLLSSCRESASLPLAADACLRPAALLSQIDGRLARLDEAALDHPELAAYLCDEYRPRLEEASEDSRKGFRHAGLPWALELPRSERTLSPSDFGCHNALRRPNGELVFLDFEYFGWDDPAKTICDFVLHPGMRLSSNLERRYVDRILRVFDQGVVRRRVELVFPLIALKWCLILLNEFVPADQQRRDFAAGEDNRQVAVQEAQLDKARRMLARAQSLELEVASVA
jgi:hypothetical protein